MATSYGDFESIGKKLKALRLELGLTQKQMAADVISPSYYSKIENGQHEIDAKSLFQLLAVHNVNISEFIDRLMKKEDSKNDYVQNFINRMKKAGNSNNLEEIDALIEEAVANKDKLFDTILLELYSFHAGIQGNSDDVPEDIKQKAKEILLKKRWVDDVSYFRRLNLYIALIDKDEAYLLITLAMHKFKDKLRKNNVDRFDLIDLQDLINNFCFLCVRRHENKKYVVELINFLKYEMPSSMNFIGSKILGTYYEALFDHDREKAKMIKEVLKDSNSVNKWMNLSIYSVDEWIDADIKLNKQ